MGKVLFRNKDDETYQNPYAQDLGYEQQPTSTKHVLFDNYFNNNSTNSDYYAYKNMNTISKNLADNGYNIPAPEYMQTNDNRKWYQKVLDLISAPFNAVTRGVNNLADDDKNTTFTQGLKEGISTGNVFKDNSKYQTSYTDVLKNLQNSSNNVKKFIGYAETAPVTLAQVMFGRDINKAQETSNKVTGVIGDLALDPLNFVGGVGEGAKLLSKGEKALKATEAIGDVDKAKDILTTLGKGASDKEAEYLFRNTAKKLGYMPDYNGITLGTNKHNVQLFSPETIAKFGDSNLGKLVGSPIRLTSDVLNAVGDTEIGKAANKLFVGGKNAEYLRNAKANPEEAMKNVALTRTLGERLLGRSRNIDELVNKTADMQKDIKKNDLNESDITNAIEKGNYVTEVPTIEHRTIVNPEFDMQAHGFLKNKVNETQKQIDNLNSQFEAMRNGTHSNEELQNINKQIDHYTNLLDRYKNVDKIDNINFTEQLKQEGFPINKVALPQEMLNPRAITEMNFDDISNYMLDNGLAKNKEIADKMSSSLKKSAENTVDSITKEYPELAPYYKGTTIKDYKDVRDFGYSNNPKEQMYNVEPNAELEAAIERDDGNDVKLMTNSKDTNNMTREEMSNYKQTLADRLLNINPNLTNVTEKMKSDISTLDSELAKGSDNAAAEMRYEATLEKTNPRNLPDEILQKSMSDAQFKEYKTTGKLPLSKYELDNLNTVQYYYDTLKSKGISEDELKKWSAGHIINRGKEFTNPQLGTLMSGVAETTSRDINKETYKKAMKDARTLLEENVNPFTNKAISNEEEFKAAIRSFEKQYSKNSMENINDFVAEHFKNVSKYDTTRDIDKFGGIKEAEKQATTYGQKVYEMNNGRYRTFEKIQKFNPDFNIETAKSMSDKQLTAYMNSLRKGESDSAKYIPKEQTNKLTKEQFVNMFKKDKGLNDVVELKPKASADVAEGKGNFMEFQHPTKGNIVIDTNADSSKAKIFADEILNSPSEYDNVTSNGTKVFMKGAVTDDGAAGRWIDNGKNDINVSDNLTAKQTRSTVKHEVTHIATSDDYKRHTDLLAGTVDRELNSLDDTAKEELKTVINSLGKSEGNKGLTDYIDSLYSGNNKKHLINQETVAELGSMFMHSKASVRDKAINLMPESYDHFMKIIQKIPENDIPKYIPKDIPLRDELITKLQLARETRNVIEDVVSTNIRNEIKPIKEKLDTLNSYFEDKDAMYNFYKSNIGKLQDIPQYKTVEDRIMKEITHNAVEELPETAKNIANIMKDSFKKWGIEEGVEDMLNYYVPHILNFDLRNNKKAQNIISKDVENPFNIFGLHRKYDKTISEMNKVMKEKHGIDNFFETMATRIYLQRGIKHENFMFQKGFLDDTMNLFSHKMLKSSDIKSMTLDDMDKVAKSLGFEFESPKEFSRNYRKAVQEKLNNDYVIVQLDKKFKPVEAKTISNENLEQAYEMKSVIRDNIEASGTNNKVLGDYVMNNPFIAVDPRAIEAKTLFEKPDEYYIMPRFARDQYVNTMQEQFKSNNNALLKVFDKLSNVFKSTAVFSGGFHVQNAIGNTLNSYLSVGKDVLNPMINAKAIQIMSGHGSFMGRKADDILELANKYGVLDNGIFNKEVKGFLENKTSTLEQSPLKKLASKGNPLNINRKIGGTIESQSRMVNFLIHLKNGKSPEEAADLVNKFLFDYNDLTQFEQSTMKRLVPFYTWLRKNVPLQLENIVTQPEKYGRMYRGYNSVQKPETEEQKRLRPKYLEDAMHTGNGNYIQANMPYQDLGKVTSLKDLFSSINPLIKTPIELMTNKNVYFDSPIQKNEGELVQAPTYLNALSEDTPNGKMVDPRLKYLLRSIIPAGENVSNAYDYLSGNEKANEDKALGFMTGVKNVKVDYDTLKRNALYDYVQKLTDMQKNATKQGYVEKSNGTSKKKYKILFNE